MKLIDTSVWIRFFNAGEPATKNAELRELIRNGEAAFCDLVRLELQSCRQTETRAIELLVATLPVLEHSPEVWDRAYHIARKCRKLGKPVPTTDILIHATAEEHHCAILHEDKHFDMLAQIK